MLILFVIVWILLGLYGSYVGISHFNRVYPSVRRGYNYPELWFMAIAGPLNLIAVFLVWSRDKTI